MRGVDAGLTVGVGLFPNPATPFEDSVERGQDATPNAGLNRFGGHNQEIGSTAVRLPDGHPETLMVFPISDDNSDRRIVPLVNYVLIGMNVFVFVVFQGMGGNEKLTYQLATVPAEIRTGKDIVTDDRVVVDPVSGQKYSAPGLQATPGSVYLTLLTSMFMHGGIAHLLGNMWFLWIFGDNVEDRMGHVRYLIFYLLTGLVASLSHVAMNLNGPSSLIPSLGASGAISGVMGAYLALCPSRRVRVLMLRVVTEIPGYMAVGLWFLFQLVSGMGLLGGGSEGDGVAYAAHVGGFVAGVLLARPFLFGLTPAPPFGSGWQGDARDRPFRRG